MLVPVKNPDRPFLSIEAVIRAHDTVTAIPVESDLYRSMCPVPDLPDARSQVLTIAVSCPCV